MTLDEDGVGGQLLPWQQGNSNVFLSTVRPDPLVGECMQTCARLGCFS